MKTFNEALKQGFPGYFAGSHVFAWKDGKNNYELWFEGLIFDDQYYVALYKNKELMTEKVVVKPGK